MDPSIYDINNIETAIQISILDAFRVNTNPQCVLIRAYCGAAANRQDVEFKMLYDD